MTKRFHSFNDNKSNKKAKGNGDLEDLWGEDFDDKDVDDCFLLASQALEENKIACTQRNNVSILPSYTAFKQTSKNRFTSTQSDPELNLSLQRPSSSKAAPNGVYKSNLKNATPGSVNQVDLKLEVKQLQEQYLAKEGEVSILRMQLRDIRASNEQELSKKQKEWSEKTAAMTKQLNSIKGELEFKNLEIANLKQKVVEVAKLSNLDTSICATQSPYFKRSRVFEKSIVSSVDASSTVVTHKMPCNKKFKLHCIKHTYHPLRYAIPTTFFTFPKEEKCLINIKHNYMGKNMVPFLQSQVSQELISQLVRLQPKATLLEGKKALNLDYIYFDLLNLMSCSMQEIDAEENLACVNKVVCVSEQLLSNLCKFLQELQQAQSGDLPAQNADTMYLEDKLSEMRLDTSLFCHEEWHETEMGINTRQSIACVSEVLPYSNYLKGYLLQNQSLAIKRNEEILTHLPSAAEKHQMDYSNSLDYLQTTLSALTLIRKLKKSHNFPGFLSAAAFLLNKICLCADLEEILPIVQDIMREIVLCGPNLRVLLGITELLKNASLQPAFVKRLCKMPPKSSLKISQKEKILYYNEQTCMLQILCILLESHILRIRHFKMIDFYLNIVAFVTNAFTARPAWLYYQEDKHCDCLCKIVKLFVDVMYRAVEVFQVEYQKKLQDKFVVHFSILRSGLQALHILHSAVYDLIVKYVSTYSQYKTIVKLLWDFRDRMDFGDSLVELMNDLNVAEDIPVVHSEKFSIVPLWN